MNAISSARRVSRSLALHAATLAGRIGPRPRPPERDGTLRILAHVPSYPPGTSAGSERSIEAILVWLRRRGHHTTVLFDDRAVEGIRDGVHVIRERSLVDTLRLYRDHDVVLTQLGTRNRAMLLSRVTSRPLVHLLRMGAVDPATAFGIPDLLVCNAAWLQQLKAWPGASTVLHPPVYADAYRTTPGEAITLINLNARKGGPTFFALAELLPEHQFLGVTGSWGDQLIPAEIPANVTVLGPVDDARDIYGRTRILLMPSSYEPYGRVSLEAAASGIPTIASQAEGIREALGDAGLFLPLDDLELWVTAIVALDDEAAYAEASTRALARSREMSPESELVDLESQLRALTPLCHASQSS